MRTTLLNITSIIIRLRLQFVGGSDNIKSLSTLPSMEWGKAFYFI